MPSAGTSTPYVPGKSPVTRYVPSSATATVWKPTAPPPAGRNERRRPIHEATPGARRVPRTTAPRRITMGGAAVVAPSRTSTPSTRCGSQPRALTASDSAPTGAASNVKRPSGPTITTSCALSPRGSSGSGLKPMPTVSSPRRSVIDRLTIASPSGEPTTRPSRRPVAGESSAGSTTSTSVESDATSETTARSSASGPIPTRFASDAPRCHGPAARSTNSNAPSSAARAVARTPFFIGLPSDDRHPALSGSGATSATGRDPRATATVAPAAGVRSERSTRPLTRRPRSSRTSIGCGSLSHAEAGIEAGANPAARTPTVSGSGCDQTASPERSVRATSTGVTMLAPHTGRPCASSTRTRRVGPISTAGKRRSPTSVVRPTSTRASTSAARRELWPGTVPAGIRWYVSTTTTVLSPARPATPVSRNRPFASVFPAARGASGGSSEGADDAPISWLSTFATTVAPVTGVPSASTTRPETAPARGRRSTISRDVSG